MKRVMYMTGVSLGTVLIIVLLLNVRGTPRENTAGDGLRVVSLAPSVTEMLFTLEVEDCIVGVTDRCDYPPEARNIDRVGGFGKPNMEKLLALSPDLVIATGLQRSDAAAALQRSGIRMLWVKTDNFLEIFEALREIGREVGKPRQAEQVVADMQAELEAVAEQHRTIPPSRRPRVFVELWHDPMTTVGRRSHIDDIIARAGGVNVAHELDSAYPTINPEKVLEWNPDVILLGHTDRRKSRMPLAERIGWNDIAAVRSGKIIEDIPSGVLLRPGPRLIEGVKMLAQRLYGTETKETVPK